MTENVPKLKQVEKYFMFMDIDIKTQYGQDVSSSHLDLYSQCKPHQNHKSYFVDIEKLILTFYGGKRSRIAKTVLKEKKIGRLILL